MREKIAELEHEQWMRWAETLILRENLSPNRVERWNKLFVPYHELSEEMKDEDRKEADIVLSLIHEAGWRSPEEVDKMVEHRIYEMYANETYQP